MNNIKIRNKIRDIIWSTSPAGAENLIIQLIEDIKEEAYREGFKAAEEKFNTKNPSIGEMEVAFNDKELEIIKAEFDKTVAEYKRADNEISREDRIKKELEYIRNPNRYIDVYNSYRDKSIAYPLAEYLDIKASQSGFDNYEDMLNEGFSIDYSGEYIKEPEKIIKSNKDNIER